MWPQLDLQTSGSIWSAKFLSPKSRYNSATAQQTHLRLDAAVCMYCTEFLILCRSSCNIFFSWLSECLSLTNHLQLCHYSFEPSHWLPFLNHIKHELFYLSKPTAVLMSFLMQKEISFYLWSAHSGIHYWLSVGITFFPFCFEGAAKPENHNTILLQTLLNNSTVLQCWHMLTADWDHNWLLLSIQFSSSKATCSIA